MNYKTLLAFTTVHVTTWDTKQQLSQETFSIEQCQQTTKKTFNRLTSARHKFRAIVVILAVSVNGVV